MVFRLKRIYWFYRAIRRIIRLSKWNAIFVNDPDNDYNLIIELECDEDNVGYIKRIGSRLDVVFYPSKNKVEIPLEWLANVIDKAKKEL
jgi:hypothetical protein